MFFRNQIYQIKVFLQLSDSFESKRDNKGQINDKIIISKLLPLEEALAEEARLKLLLKQIGSEDATYVEVLQPNRNSQVWQNFINLARERDENPEADSDNYKITLDARQQEVKSFLKARNVIDLSKIKNLNKLVFISKQQEEERTRRYRLL